jgi:chemotaxis response regulator CheB
LAVRVLIVSAQPLFGQGVEAWLRQQRGLDIIGWEAETGRAVSRIQQLKPDVIILDTSAFAMSPTTALMEFLSHTSDSQIVGIDLRNNSVSVFGREQPATAQLGELLDLLKEHGVACPDYNQNGNAHGSEASEPDVMRT